MRILFVLSNVTFFRYVDGIVRQLAAEGVNVVVWAKDQPNLAMQRCQQEFSNVSYGELPKATYKLNRWLRSWRELRSYVHWLSPAYRCPQYLRTRWVSALPRQVRRIIRLLGLPRFEYIISKMPWLESLLHRVERIVPCDKEIARAIRALAPDLVVGTPVIFPDSLELEHLKAAKQMEIPAIVLIASWDNLSTKGTFHLEPDWVLVWNEIQRREAATLHGIMPAKVIVTGAPVFDDWFSSHYRMSREEFCQKAGLCPKLPYVVYLDSSPASGDEKPMVSALAQHFQEMGLFERVQLLVRPHPKKAKKWDTMQPQHTVVWPQDGKFVDVFETKQDYFNTLYHSFAAIGVNTSAFIEATILDRPCISITSEKHRYFQEQIIHFNYLLEAGFLYTAPNESACASLVGDLLMGTDNKQAARKSFVSSFVRPIGTKKTSAQITTDFLKRVGNGRG